MTRGQRGRRIGRQMIALAVLCGFATLFVWVAQPGFIGPMFGVAPWYAPLVPVVGLASYFLGLVWMVRIHRANPEPDQHAWRYRADR